MQNPLKSSTFAADLNVVLMVKLDFKNLDRGIVLCSRQDLVFDESTNVTEVLPFIVITRNPEPARHDVSVLIIDTTLVASQDITNIIEQLKAYYDDNLVALLDMQGKQL